MICNFIRQKPGRTDLSSPNSEMWLWSWRAFSDPKKGLAQCRSRTLHHSGILQPTMEWQLPCLCPRDRGRYLRNVMALGTVWPTLGAGQVVYCMWRLPRKPRPLGLSPMKVGSGVLNGKWPSLLWSGRHGCRAFIQRFYTEDGDDGGMNQLRLCSLKNWPSNFPGMIVGHLWHLYVSEFMTNLGPGC